MLRLSSSFTRLYFLVNSLIVWEPSRKSASFVPHSDRTRRRQQILSTHRLFQTGIVVHVCVSPSLSSSSRSARNPNLARYGKALIFFVSNQSSVVLELVCCSARVSTFPQQLWLQSAAKLFLLPQVTSLSLFLIS